MKKVKIKGDQVIIWLICILITALLWQLPIFKG